MAHRPRKRFGQNFLTDATAIARILAALAPAPGQLVIEIGPGRAALTVPLLASGAEVVAVEIDRDLAGALAASHPGLRVVQADALQLDFAALAHGRPYRLVGNLPYNISTPLLFHLLSQSHLPLDMHFMLQKEVVDRMAALPGDGDYGRLTLGCQNRCEVSPLFTIGPGSFDPPPRVESTVVRLIPRAQPRVPAELQAGFDRLVSRAFSMRRKTLRNALRGELDEAAISAAGVDPGVRPEQVDLEGWLRLARALAR